MESIWQFLIQNGVTTIQIEMLKQIYLFLLMLPIVTTVVGIARYIVGLRTINFYTPVFITFILYEASNPSNSEPNVIKGLIIGMILLATVFVFTALLYRLLKRLRMHYIPKLSIIISGVTLSVFAVITLLVIFGKTTALLITPLSFVALIVTSEGFMSIYAKKNFKYVATITLETLTISLISFLILSINPIQSFILNNPWVILLIVLINFYVGRFLGLRISEYIRFRKLLLNKENLDEYNKPDTKK